MKKVNVIPVCIDIVNAICHNEVMEMHKYRVFKIKGQKFVVKMDLNPLTNEYEYHMYIRHLITAFHQGGLHD